MCVWVCRVWPTGNLDSTQNVTSSPPPDQQNQDQPVFFFLELNELLNWDTHKKNNKQNAAKPIKPEKQ